MSYYDHEDEFELMGSGLMGGSTTIPLTPEEREQYLKGISIKAKYVGVIEVPKPRGMQMVATAIGRVRAVHKSSKESKQKVWFVISTQGIKMYTYDTRELCDSFSLEKISFVAALPSNKKVFGFVTVNDTVSPAVYKCHVYKSDTKSLLIAETIGRCFTLATDIKRQKKSQRPPRPQPPRNLPQPQRAASSARSVRSERSSHSSRQNQRVTFTGNTQFSDVVEAMKRTLGTYDMISDDRHFMLNSFNVLEDMYASAERRNQILEQTSQRLTSEKLALQQRKMQHQQQLSPRDTRSISSSSRRNYSVS